MREPEIIYDRATGPIYRFTLPTDGLAKDLSNAAFEIYTFDENGVQIGRRPGRIVSPKATSGFVDLTFDAPDTDRDGAGGAVTLKCRAHYAVLNDGSDAAPNLLANASFDTGTVIATSWTQNGTLGPMIYEVRDDDPWPPVIFGKCQRSFVPIGGGSSAYLIQSPVTSATPGMWMSGGVWVRSHPNVGATVFGGGHYVELNGGRPEQVRMDIPTTPFGWRFFTVESRALNSYGTIPFGLVNYDLTGYEIRYDDAFAFLGKWRIVHSQPIRIPIQARAVPPRKAISTLACVSAGWCGFEYDSDADGVADGFSKTGSVNVYTHETDPDFLNIGYNPNGVGSQKVLLQSATADRLRTIVRVKILPVEVWTVRLQYRNSNALTGSPAAGNFGLVIHSEEFDGIYEESSTVGANFSLSSVSSFVVKTVSLGFTAAHNCIVVDINLNGVSGGSIWLDDLEVFQVS